MEKIRNNIPNAITLLNLTGGALSVIFALKGDLILAAWFIILAAIFDFFDGFVARLLNAKSGIGAQLDSLADVVSFGFAPAAILFGLLQASPGLPGIKVGEELLLPYFSLMILVCSAYRLARFNIDPGQEYQFSGLPTPATGLFVAALPLIEHRFSGNEILVSLVTNPYILLFIVLFLSWLMISKIPMMAIKFRNFSWKDNKTRFILMIVSPLLIVFLQYLGLVLAILLYIMLSGIDRILRSKPWRPGS